MPDLIRHPEHTEITGFRLPNQVRHRLRRNDAFMGFQTFYETVIVWMSKLRVCSGSCRAYEIRSKNLNLSDIAALENWIELEKKINDRSGLNASVFDAAGVRITDFKKWANKLCPVIKSNQKGQNFICALAHQTCFVPYFVLHPNTLFRWLWIPQRITGCV
jgi:hypothetical protein